MSIFFTRPIRLSIVTAVSCALLSVAAVADGPAPSAAAPGSPPTATIRWIDGFAEGAAAGKASGRLLLVLATRYVPPCGYCRKLEAAIWSKPESAAISDRYVAVRILGGEHATPQAEAFFKRYEVDGFPTMFAMTADGAVVASVSGFGEGGKTLTAADILKQMEDATAREAAFQRLRADLTAKGDAASLGELGGMLMERHDFDGARAIFLGLASKDPSVLHYGMLAGIYERMGQRVDERRTLETMVARFSDHPERIEWRIRLTTMDLPNEVKSREEMDALVRRHEAALNALLQQIEKEAVVADQAEIHVRLANFAGQRSDAAGVKSHLQWILDHDGKGRRAPGALMALARQAFDAGDNATAVTLLERVVADFPNSGEAREARDVLPGVKAGG
jgi:hypothetical protein